MHSINRYYSVLLICLPTLFFFSCRNPLKSRLEDQKMAKSQASPSISFKREQSKYTTVFSAYEQLRATLASDDLPKVEGVANNLSKETEKILKNASEADRELLLKTMEALPSLKTQKDNEVRIAFGRVSEPLVSLYKKSGSTELQLYHCPMAREYGYWLQPKNQPISNPYMGSRMASCGSKVD